MARFTIRPLRVAVSALMAAVMLLFAAVPSYAADPVAPGVSDVDWDRYSQELKNRGTAARMPVKAGATRTGASFNSQAAMKRARAAYAQRHVTSSKPATPASPGRVTAPEAPKPGPGARKVGLKMAKGAAGAVAGVVGFNLAYEMTGSVMGGLFGLESNGFFCDLGTAFGNSDCALAADPGYVPNDGVPGQPAGWALPFGSQIVLNPGGRWYSTQNPSIYPQDVPVTLQISGDPQFRSKKGSFTVSATMTGNCSPSAQGPSINDVIAVGKDSSGRIVNLKISYDLRSLRADCGANQTGSATVSYDFSSSNLYFFDHVKVAPSSSSGSAETAPSLYWYPEGHELWTPGTDPDPRRLWQTSWQCDVGGGVIMHGSAESEPFFETDPEWPGFPEAVCEEGTLVEWHIDQISDGLEPLRIYEWTLPDDVAEWAAEYPQCTDASCTLELQRLDQSTGKALACFDAPELCADWFTDPNKTENYQCVYGGQILPLDECNLYAPTFSQKLGGGIGDPVTGEKIDTVTTGPGTAPTDPLITQPGTSIWGSNTRPGNCPPPFSWSSLINPWWYYQGVKCALVETFIPAEPSAPFLAVSQAWDKTRIGQMFVSWTGMFDNLRVASSCAGPSFTWPDSSAKYGLVGTIAPFNACTGWGKEWAPRINGALTWIAGAYFSMAIVSTIARGFGFDLNAATDTKKAS